MPNGKFPTQIPFEPTKPKIRVKAAHGNQKSMRFFIAYVSGCDEPSLPPLFYFVLPPPTLFYDIVFALYSFKDIPV